MSQEQTREPIREFLSLHFNNQLPDDDEDIFATGYVNSLFAMQLVAFVEKRFGIALESEDLDFDNFRTVNRLAGLVEAKTSASA